MRFLITFDIIAKKFDEKILEKQISRTINNSNHIHFFFMLKS